MRVVGVDLAWRTNKRTGLCVVEDGRVLDSTAVVTDDEVDAWIRRWWDEEILLAIDAPIVVENLFGCRPVELVLAAAYGREHAGPFPANRSMASFQGGTRARALAGRLGLSVDPAAVDAHPVRVAIEVYPHPALVSLFALPASLKYKRKPGRSPAARRRAFEELVECLEKLAAFDPPLDPSTSPRWGALVEAVGAAHLGADLSRVEDEVDAYVCAYVGRYHLRWRGTRSLTVGDGASGCIVTPVDPEHAERVRAQAAHHGVAVQ